MFGFSVAYNITPPSPLKWLLRRFDHSSIYLMIAGTYTPLLWQLHDRIWALALALVVWIGAIAGIILKVALPGRFDRLSIVIYLLLGWVAIIATKPLIDSLPGPTLILVAVGGLLYSVGIVFYLWHSLKFQNAMRRGVDAGRREPRRQMWCVCSARASDVRHRQGPGRWSWQRVSRFGTGGTQGSVNHENN